VRRNRFSNTLTGHGLNNILQQIIVLSHIAHLPYTCPPERRVPVDVGSVLVDLGGEEGAVMLER
jgi:hypothetical protein